jgi:hypothetical protein
MALLTVPYFLEEKKYLLQVIHFTMCNICIMFYGEHFSQPHFLIEIMPTQLNINPIILGRKSVPSLQNKKKYVYTYMYYM